MSATLIVSTTPLIMLVEVSACDDLLIADQHAHLLSPAPRLNPAEST